MCGIGEEVTVVVIEPVESPVPMESPAPDTETDPAVPQKEPAKT